MIAKPIAYRGKIILTKLGVPPKYHIKGETNYYDSIDQIKEHLDKTVITTAEQYRLDNPDDYLMDIPKSLLPEGTTLEDLQRSKEEMIDTIVKGWSEGKIKAIGDKSAVDFSDEQELRDYLEKIDE